ncbi:MAG: MaoC family dehydratase [Anaerolineaceae bacterium]
MSTSTQASDWAVERHFEAFLDGLDSPDISNPIHSTEVARAFGFKAALVGGVTVWGWCARAIVEALGERWLEDGWADVYFRQPVYPGDSLTIRVASGPQPRAFEVANQDGEVCMRGEMGLGNAPWLEDLTDSAWRTAESAPVELPELTLESAPTARELRPMALPYQLEEATAYAAEKQHDEALPWVGPGARIHPGWVAARMTPLLKHSFAYGPSIHTRTQVQHLSPALVGQTVTVAGRFIRAYERKGHHVADLDGLLLSETGVTLARLRHTTIFRPRPVNQPA